MLNTWVAQTTSSFPGLALTCTVSDEGLARAERSRKRTPRNIAKEITSNKIEGQ